MEKQLAIGAEQTTGELWEKLANMGAELLVKTLQNLSTITPRPQDHGLASYAPLLEKSHGQIDWNDTTRDVHNKIRGVNPWPGAWVHFREQKLKIWKAEPAIGYAGAPGTVLSTKKTPVIATKDGAIRLLEIQLPGKKRGPSINLINGARLTEGEVL